MTHLRPYQRDAIDAVYDYWSTDGGNALIDLATGTGKSVVLATLMRELLDQYPLMRILCLVHVRELVAQNFQQLLRLWPQAPAGVNSAGLGRRDTRDAILFASIQSVFRDPASLGKRDLVLIDEAHLIPLSPQNKTIGGDGMYHQLLDGLRSASPDLRVMGCTATPYRLDSGRLDQGDDRLFDRIVYTYSVVDGIEDKFLSPLVSKGMKNEINVTEVAKRGGEFVSGALEKAADQSEAIKGAVDEMLLHGKDRRSWLVFCSGVDHAHHVCAEIRSRGVIAETVTGTTAKAERDRILSGFKAGYIKAVCNMSVLTTGFDAPNVDLIAMLRPTLSTGLYVQMLGRGTRLAPKKENCLVLDFSGNVRRHGPIDLISPPSRRKLSATERDEYSAQVNSVKAKECPNCMALVGIRAPSCDYCGYEWPVEAKHQAKADDVNIMSGRDRAGWVPVTSIHYYRHTKRNAAPGTPNTLRVSYGMGFDAISSWYCFDHPQGSMPQRKAVTWWLEAGGKLPAPNSVDEALTRTAELKQPNAIIHGKDENGFKQVKQRRYQAPSGEVPKPPVAKPAISAVEAKLLKELDGLAF